MDLYEVSKFFVPLGEAGNLLAIALIVFLGICATSRRAPIRNSAIAGAALVGISLLLPLGTWALSPLERRFPTPKLPNSIDGILLLGGGTDNPERFWLWVSLQEIFPMRAWCFPMWMQMPAGLDFDSLESIRRAQ